MATLLSSNSVSKSKSSMLLNGPLFFRVSDRQLLLSLLPGKQRSIVVKISMMKVPQAPMLKSNGKSPRRFTVHSETTDILIKII